MIAPRTASTTVPAHAARGGRPSRRAHLSIQSTIMLAQLLILASVMVAAIGLRSATHVREAVAHADNTAAALAAALAATLRDQAAGAAWSDLRPETFTSHPAIAALAVWGEDGSPLLESRRSDGPTIALRQPRSGEDRIRIRRFRHQAPGRAATDLHQVDVPLGAFAPASPPDARTAPAVSGRMAGRTATASFLVQLDRGALPPGRDLWFFYAPLVGVGLVGLLLGTWWLRREVLAPIAALSAPDSETFQRVLASCPQYRMAELDTLVERLHRLQKEAEDWRLRAAQVERRVQGEIAERTRGILHELQHARRAMWTDSLTGLHNRRFLDDRLNEIITAQRDADGELSVILLDIDNFKALNDTVGHEAGDRLLRVVGGLLQQSTREDDIAARIGGDEFLLVLPGTKPEDAASVARRIESRFAAHAAEIEGTTLPLGISSGVAALRADQPPHAAALVAMADKRMYASKRQRHAATCAAGRCDGRSATSLAAPIPLASPETSGRRP